ncbi:hypothetical protein EDB85DRAFT_2147899 [Lactarius pseudohatsudake]|nr:hypothetical protein EDB85DRAFT_2147899 [Lactarius pseudohatsudake]
MLLPSTVPSGVSTMCGGISGPYRGRSGTAPASSSSSTSSPTAPPPQPPSTVEQLPANIPHLETDGSNWTVFAMRFHRAMKVTHQWGIFDGSNSSPLPKDPLAHMVEQR